jgi:3-oxoacyl-[acyl-carrier protein] reductase
MDNIILILGASSDLGIQLIKSINEDCLIIAHYHSNINRFDNLETVSKNKIIPIHADFSSESSVSEFIHQVEAFGTPTKIVHLAASKFENTRFRSLNPNSFINELNISLVSFMRILKAFLPKMALQRKGRIVTLLSSVTFGVPPKALSQYTTIKYALLGLMKSVASEYGEKKITFNGISPSMIETQFISKLNEKIIEISAQNNPLKRNAMVDDVVPTILFLLSEDAKFINGTNIPITGGSNF